jgi:hypothetical protein
MANGEPMWGGQLRIIASLVVCTLVRIPDIHRVECGDRLLRRHAPCVQGPLSPGRYGTRCLSTYASRQA